MLKRHLVALVAVLAFAVASAQDLRAWMDLNFGDSPEIVQAKMEAMQAEGRIAPGGVWQGQDYSRIARDPTTSTYPVSIAGVDMRLNFDFYDNKLYRLNFDTSPVNASYWDAEVLPNAAIVRDVLRTALGAPSSRYNVGFLDMRNGFIKWTDVWRSGGVSRYLGLYESGSRFGVELRIEWDWMARFIAEHEGQEREQGIQDAAGGF